MTTLKRTWPVPAPRWPSLALGRARMPSPSFWVELLLAVAVVVVSILARPAIDRLGSTPYQEFLRGQWLLVDGGKGLHLDSLSLPVAPLVYVGASAVAGPGNADRWLPVLLNVAILLVLTRLLLRDYPLIAKLVAAALLIASPLFYLLQRQLDVQIYVLLLGLQLLMLRAFRMQPTVPRITAAIGINILLSLTTYMALPALLAASIYLVVLTERQREVLPAAWRALMWLFIPFSFVGYALWAVFWTVAGSRLKTSYFIPSADGGPSQLHQLLESLGGDLALPLVSMFALLVAAIVVLHRPGGGPRSGREQALAWAVLTFMALALGLAGLQTLVQRLPIQVEVITFSLILVIPAALASVFGQIRDGFTRLSRTTRVALLAAAVVVLVVFPLEYILRPAMVDGRLPAADPRQAAEKHAAQEFVKNDPGGRILLDTRFTATFVRTAGIDPRRLITPFDEGFERLVADPPADVKVIVVTDTLEDAVAGNYPAGRIVELLPNATSIAEGRADSAGGPLLVRAFKREMFAPPNQDAPPVAPDPAVLRMEDTILGAIQAEMQTRGGLPLRPDGWAYAVDMGNLMVYAAHRGDIKLFRQFSDVVERDYLTTKSDDPNALYTAAWRHRPDRKNEASGTTETLRMVEAYWTAGERWDNEYYRRLAYLMARAYVRHQWSDEFGEGWFIRNYYNYETKEYATNTFLVDYAPDVLRVVGERMGDKNLVKAADAATVFVVGAQLESGLFHEMYQPEISTLYANITFFSPNGIIQLIDSVEAALGVAEFSSPASARKTYDFAKYHFFAGGTRTISNQFYMDGLSTTGQENAPAVYAYLIRLGVRLGDRAWARELIAEKLATDRLYQASPLPVDQDYNWFFAWTSSLVALRDYQEYTSH